jgi:hypothetical protein
MERYTWSGDPRRCNLVVNGRIEWLDRVRRRYTVRRHVCLVRFLCPEDRGLNLARCRFLVWKMHRDGCQNSSGGTSASDDLTFRCIRIKVYTFALWVYDGECTEGQDGHAPETR